MPQADQASPVDFFISFTGRDRAWADWIAWQLDNAGYSCLYQPWHFAPGSNFVLDMDRAARCSAHVLAVLSEKYVASPFPQAEWAEAFARGNDKLIPVRIENFELEGLLRQIVYIDLAEIPDEESAVRTLLDGIAAARLRPKTPEFSARPKEAPPFPADILASQCKEEHRNDPLSFLENITPWPGLKVPLSDEFEPPSLIALKAYTDDPLRLDFILDIGNSAMAIAHLRDEAAHLLKCFLTALAVRDEDLWVNLAPEEPTRILSTPLTATLLGQTLLQQDYILKQTTATLQYPETEQGATFWRRVHDATTTYLGRSIRDFESLSDWYKTIHWIEFNPDALDTWESWLTHFESTSEDSKSDRERICGWLQSVVKILRSSLPDRAEADRCLSMIETWDETLQWMEARSSKVTKDFRLLAYFLNSTLDKIRAGLVPGEAETVSRIWITPGRARMAEADDTAFILEAILQLQFEEHYKAASGGNDGLRPVTAKGSEEGLAATNQIFTELLLPYLTREVNRGRNFGPLRQAYKSILLASWFKNALRRTALHEAYVDRDASIDGGRARDGFGADMHDRYVEAVRTGVFEYIREENDDVVDLIVPRKYFAGGFDAKNIFQNSSIDGAFRGDLPLGFSASPERFFWVRVRLVEGDGHEHLSDDVSGGGPIGGIDLNPSRGEMNFHQQGHAFRFEAASEVFRRLVANTTARLYPVILAIEPLKSPLGDTQP